MDALSRMPAVDRNVLRLGAYELLYRDDVPEGVAVSEAVELVGRLSTDESAAFVNGVLAQGGSAPSAGQPRVRRSRQHAARRVTARPN